MKPMPVSCRHCATCSGVRLTMAPSASSTSALPELDDTLRPPCFATRAPAAAATNIAAVEMLKVCALSPPVPHDVDQVRLVGHLDRRRELAHHLRRGGDLADRLLLHAQAHRERRDHHRRHLAAHDAAHQREHLVVEDLAMLDHAGQRFGVGDRHGRLSSMRQCNCRKFRSIAWPCSVRIDSGWNCTPSSGVACRRARGVARP